MWDFLIRNYNFSYLLIVALIFFGVFAVINIPKESAPEVEIPVGVITSTLSGASPEEIEKQITIPIERGVANTVANIDSITSTSREGISVITVEFEAESDLDTAIDALKSEVELLKNELPEDATSPRVENVDFVNQPILTFAISGIQTADAKYSAKEEIETIVENVDGVASVSTRGAQSPEIFVSLNQEDLLRYDLTTSEIIQAISQANQSLPVGSIISEDVTYTISFDSDIKSANELAEIAVKNTGNQVVLLDDVAEISSGFSTLDTYERVSIDNTPSESALIFDVYKQSGGDIMTVSQNVQEALEESWQLPTFANTDYYVINDTGEFIANDLKQLTRSGLQTVLLVILLLVITLGWREGIIAGTAIPLSFTLGFIGLLLSGNTINFISLFALILGIGILVDSSIVMIEDINRRLKNDPDKDKTEAAIETIHAFKKPITAGTLTTVAMFSGLFIVSGVTGQFIASIPFTLISILLASLFVAIGIIPLFAATFLRRRNRTKIEEIQVNYAKKIEAWYSKKLRDFLNNSRYQRRFILALSVGFVTSFLLIPLGLVSVIFFGSGDADQLFIELEARTNTPLAITDRSIRSLEEILYDIPEVEGFSSSVGAGSVYSGGGQGDNIASIQLNLKEDRERTSQAIAEEIRLRSQQIPQTEITINQPEAGPPTGAPVVINLYGEDLLQLRETAQKVARTLEATPGIREVSSGIEIGNTQYTLKYNWENAGFYGSSPFTTSETIRNTITGSKAVDLSIADDDVPVTVYQKSPNSLNLSQADKNKLNIDDLLRTPIPTGSGDSVLLDTLVTTELTPAQTEIKRNDQTRFMEVSANVNEETTVAEALRVIQTTLEEESIIPSNISYTFGGENEESSQAFQEMFLALLIGIILMIAVLVLQFNSFRYTLYVLSIVPFSLIGILYGLAIVGSPLSFPSLMGFIALTGIVVNNSILLIDIINTTRINKPDLPITEAVISSSSSRLRPILLTTITTVLGITPLLFTDPIWVPLATAIMFGLSFSVIITLVLIPLIYNKYPGKLN